MIPSALWFCVLLITIEILNLAVVNILNGSWIIIEPLLSYARDNSLKSISFSCFDLFNASDQSKTSPAICQQIKVTVSGFSTTEVTHSTN